MRIVAGSAKGRPLAGPKDDTVTRPTADRVRQTLFDVLGQFFTGGRVLDLFAGTGALAFEALSRGAERAVLVDRSREAVGLCQSNARSLGFEARCEIIRGNVDDVWGRLSGPFHLVFADPPYDARVGRGVLEQLSARKLLEPEGWIVIEHSRHEELPAEAAGLVRVDERRFGETLVSLYRVRAREGSD